MRRAGGVWQRFGLNGATGVTGVLRSVVIAWTSIARRVRCVKWRLSHWRGLPLHRRGESKEGPGGVTLLAKQGNPLLASIYKLKNILAVSLRSCPVVTHCIQSNTQSDPHHMSTVKRPPDVPPRTLLSYHSQPTCSISLCTRSGKKNTAHEFRGNLVMWWLQRELQVKLAGPQVELVLIGARGHHATVTFTILLNS